MNPQLAGVEAIEGTYLFDLRHSVKAYRLNRYLWMHRDPRFREQVLNDPEAAFAEMRLTAEERDLIARRDWLGLIQYGVSFFVLEKYARVVRISNLQVYASMRGETLEAFLKTRRVPASA
ncbi:protocatechuate 3,4-dioxygenase [Pararobbsia alpina]|uniref:Gallate dioxygenase n=1 Tax=Pararobbsia alpina TaxID=621374 RepID=A0A6S7AWK5_9BURK|nr:protocatechuate 3,4-dioxygenase [Pararobbsia alpina]CAB3780064.1 Gallate dioxygenase [Pararobbsia alpina]